MNSGIAKQDATDTDTVQLTISEDTSPSTAESSPDRPRRRDRAQQFKRAKYDVHGWVALDKPVGMTSTHAVSVIKRLFAAKRAGHAGTLDPLASGCLPFAVGDATE